jgi:hypothetical protein
VIGDNCLTLHQKQINNNKKNKDYEDKEEFGKHGAHEHRYRSNSVRFHILQQLHG